MRFLLVLAVLVLVGVPAILFGGFIWMICLGALSHIFNYPNIAISYWYSVLVAVIFSVLFGGIGSGKN